MNKKPENQSQVDKEFQEFLCCCDCPCEDSRKSVLSNVKRLLNPTFWNVFKKLGIVQLFAGSITLLFCPQFGIGPLGGGHGLMHIFMEMGPVICALGCGSFFLGTAAIIAPFFLTREERKLAARTGLWQFGLLGVFSMALLMLLTYVSDGYWVSLSLETTLFWLVGGSLSAWLILFLTGPKALRRPL